MSQIEQYVNKIICGSAQERLKELPSKAVSCIITSPPYWALRDYGVEPMIWDDGWTGCLGLEPTIELYLKHLVGIFDEAKRALRDDGTCFVNLGDTYGGPQGESNKPKINPKQLKEWQNASHVKAKLQPKSLCLIPFRFAIEMVNHGWILRNTIIWSKPNPMPSSAKDRFTVDFEYVFFFSKKKKYWFEPQYEALQETTVNRVKYPHHSKGTKAESGNYSYPPDFKYGDYSLGRNKRTTWTIPTEAFPEAHFATFPCALVEPMIKSGCPEFICKKCWKARVKIFESNSPKDKKQWPTGWGNRGFKGEKHTGAHTHNITEQAFKGYTSCPCDAGYKPGIVLDFFCGSGTVGKVAAYLRRNYILIDAKKEYCQMAEERVREPETGITVKEQRQGQQSLFRS